MLEESRTLKGKQENRMNKIYIWFLGKAMKSFKSDKKSSEIRKYWSTSLLSKHIDIFNGFWHFLQIGAEERSDKTTEISHFDELGKINIRTRKGE